MNSSKIRVGIMFGGQSAEHEVSLQSAYNVIEAIDKSKYEVLLIGVDKEGQWHLSDSSQFLLNISDPKAIKLYKSGPEVALLPGGKNKQLVCTKMGHVPKNLDVIFPILHGPFGEDGTVQGMLKLANIPFVGAGVLGSAVGMDKDIMKRLLRDAGILIGRFLIASRREGLALTFDEVVAILGCPIFIKPANLGSSVGISKVNDATQFDVAIETALRFDNKLVLEENITGREIEVAVLGNEEPQASIPGEIIPYHEFYSYEAKYIEENGAALKIPAKLPEAQVHRIQELAVRSFQVLECEGMARVDCFLTEDNSIYVNEINTIPGFTKISMYPRLWEASGLPYAELIDRLIELAFERYKREKRLQVSYDFE